MVRFKVHYGDCMSDGSGDGMMMFCRLAVEDGHITCECTFSIKRCNLRNS